MAARRYKFAGNHREHRAKKGRKGPTPKFAKLKMCREKKEMLKSETQNNNH